MRRREMIGAIAAGAAVSARTFAQKVGENKPRRFRQGVTLGVFDPKIPFEDKCRMAVELGCTGFDLIPPRDWPILKRYGLIPSMAPSNMGVTIPDGLNRRENHDRDGSHNASGD